MNQQDNTQTRSDNITLPYQRFDIVAKDPFYNLPWVIGGLRHERQDLLQTLWEDIVNNSTDSTVYEMIIERGMERGMEQGIEQGRKQGTKDGIIESITVLLDKRFEMNTTPILTPLLETIDDLQQVKHLFQEALEVEHLEDFIRSVQNIQNGA